MDSSVKLLLSDEANVELYLKQIFF